MSKLMHDNKIIIFLQDGGTPLFVASQCGHLHVVKELLCMGANVHAAMTVSLYNIVFKKINFENIPSV